MNFRTLDLNLLRVFDRVMSEGSLTRAAESLAITQPAASHALRRLHEAVGEPLFVRSAHGMKPTPRAEALWPQVRAALSTLRSALAPEAFDPSVGDTSFRLAMADASATLLAPQLLSMLEAARARVGLRFLPLATRDPRRLLRDGEADLAIGHFPNALAAILAEGPASGFGRHGLHHTRYVCVMRRDHPLAGRALRLDEYLTAQHLLVSFSGRPHGLVDGALAAIGQQRRIVLTVNQFFTAGRLVATSDLLTVLPLSFVAATGFADRLVTAELPFPMDPVAIEMVWASRHEGDPAHRWLREQVARAYAGSDGGGH